MILIHLIKCGGAESSNEIVTRESYLGKLGNKQQLLLGIEWLGR